MEYTVTAALFLLFGLLLIAIQRRLGERRLWLGLLIFLGLTVIFDSLAIKAQLYAYSPRFRSGLQLLEAPIEDLIYGAALYLVAIATYTWIRRR
ncbi:MAG: lycopene cyclase domain-containing protein [Candidatus Dormibacteraceae bacterium]